jgi:bifunctional UDP-N-acetylglucosamine pyrophosphorylase/glucosamine-1-phosphate N-acetyltransferase
MSAVAVILAAGKSKRMQSDLPKVLHQACGRPIVEYVLDAARQAGCDRLVVVVGHQAERVKENLRHHPDVEFALQAEQLGTGHAVMMAEPLLRDYSGPMLVLTGDTPLLRAKSLQGLLDRQRQKNAACVVGTARTENNEGLGRIVRDPKWQFLKIVEQKDADEQQRKITEINTGCFAYNAADLFAALKSVRPNNVQAEYYLTDCAEILRSQGRLVEALEIFDIQEALGVNTQEQLADVERVMRGAGKAG